jgi:hypothetical protein
VVFWWDFECDAEIVVFLPTLVIARCAILIVAEVNKGVYKTTRTLCHSCYVDSAPLVALKDAILRNNFPQLEVST